MIYLLIVVIVLVAVALVVYFLRRRKYKRKTVEQPTVRPKSPAELKQLFTSIGAQVLTGKDNEYVVAYQGGRFIVSYKSVIDTVDLIYPNFEELKYEEITAALMSANSVNLHYGGWTCYLGLGRDETVESPKMSLSYRLSLHGTSEFAAKALARTMRDAFFVARDFSEKFDKDSRFRKSMAMEFLTGDFENKLALVRNQLDAGWGALSKEEQPEDETLTLSSLLNLYEEVDWSGLQTLRVWIGEQCEVIKETEAVLSFNIRDYIKQHYAMHDLSEVLLSLTGKNGSLSIALYRQSSSTEKLLFYQMIMGRTENELSNRVYDNPDAYAKRMLIEVRLTSEKEDYWEAKYMIDEARDKQKAGDFGNLTEIQKAVLTYTDGGLQTNIYWAMKYYNAGCYYQSLVYFRRIYSYFHTAWKDLSENRKLDYYRICFYMGTIYMEMNLNEKAFYYLWQAKRANTPSEIEMFVNCLYRLNDPLTSDMIRPYLKRTRDLLEEEGEENENLRTFFRALRRKFISSLVEVGKYMEAREWLNRMIRTNDDVDFAQRELGYLDSLSGSEELDFLTE